jgi:hypothetical protein
LNVLQRLVQQVLVPGVLQKLVLLVLMPGVLLVMLGPREVPVQNPSKVLTAHRMPIEIRFAVRTELAS